MSPAGNHVPGETTIQLGGGSYRARLPLPLATELQTLRGLKVTYPDGSTAIRPKPLGLIWREMCESGEYDIGDAEQIIILGLIGGRQGVNAAGESLEVSRPMAEKLVLDYVTGRPGEAPPMPLEEIWQTAMRVLIASCQGYVAEGGNPGNGQAGQTTGSPMSTSPSVSPTASSGESPSATPET